MGEVVVTGQRQRGAVIGDILPEIQLDAQDIRALGVGSLAELLEALGPQIRSGRGRGDGPPITLLNGRRISGFSEIRDIPPEAIERFEILPEEVALKYGYRADQRVVNIVLRERFRARTLELAAGLPTAGGRRDATADLNVLRINREGRWSVDAEYRSSSPLLESDRDLRPLRSSELFDLVGNLGADPPGGEIDPALSALVGRPVTVAGTPASAAGGAPQLSDLAATAGAPNETDLGAFRTLLPETDQVALNATVNRTLFGDVSATLNARFEANESRSLLGLPSTTLSLPAGSPFSPFSSDVLLYRYLDARGPLAREGSRRNAQLGLALNGNLSSWRWSLTANYDLNNNLTLTDRGLDVTDVQARIRAGDPGLNPFGPIQAELIGPNLQDRARSANRTANAELVFSGSLAELPAGQLSTTLKTGLEARSLESETERREARQSASLSRERANVQLNIDLPIASRRREVLTGLGNLSANANVELEQLSDFGALTTLGYGINWSPIEKLRILASVTREEGAPSVQQLGDPVVLTPNVPVFDFSRGETVQVTRVEGGDPGLRPDQRRVLKLGFNLRPFEERDLSLSLNYTTSRTEDLIAFFPALTPEIEGAFPDRFVRDESGRLVQVDVRPVNFERVDRDELRTGFDYSRPLGHRSGERSPGRPDRLGPPPAGSQAGGGASRGADRPRGPGLGGRGGPRGGRGFGGTEGRLQFALYHTYRIRDSILIREGGPELDFLNGSAAGSRGGRSRHELDLQAGLFKQGLGARLEAQWQSGTVVLAESAASREMASDLTFSDLTTMTVRLFADLGQRPALVRRRPWLRGSRVSLSVNNLFDARLEVRDETGTTPVSYQPAFLDPLGRTVRISFRKLFSGPAE